MVSKLKSSGLVVEDGDEAADLLADARDFYGEAFLAEAQAKAKAATSSTEYDELWEELNAEDGAYIAFKTASASRGTAGIGANIGSLSASYAGDQSGNSGSNVSTLLKSVSIPGFGRADAATAERVIAQSGMVAGVKRKAPPSDELLEDNAPIQSLSVGSILLNAARSNQLLPIENGPGCVITGGGKRLRLAPQSGNGYVASSSSSAQSAVARAGDSIAITPEMLAAAAAAKAVAANKKVAVTQTVKFAGKTMTVTRLVTPGTMAAKQIADEAATAAARAAISAAAAAAGEGETSAASSSGAAAAEGVPSSASASAPGSAGAGGGGGGVSLDALVANLDKPEAISTLTKSSLDWETYKHAHGLDDELERCVPTFVVCRICYCSLCIIVMRRQHYRSLLSSSPTHRRSRPAPPSPSALMSPLTLPCLPFRCLSWTAFPFSACLPVCLPWTAGRPRADTWTVSSSCREWTNGALS